MCANLAKRLCGAIRSERSGNQRHGAYWVAATYVHVGRLRCAQVAT